MRTITLVCASLAAALSPLAASVALADDPNDPSMRNPANRARDHEIIRQMNLAELAKVQRRDAQYAQGWSQWRAYHGSDHRRGTAIVDRGDDGYGGREFATRDDEGQSSYARERARYERDMAQWRRAVAACRSGDYDACDN